MKTLEQNNLNKIKTGTAFHFHGNLVPVLVCICPRFQGSVIFRNMNNRKTRLLPSKAIDTAAVYIHTAARCMSDNRQTGDYLTAAVTAAVYET